MISVYVYNQPMQPIRIGYYPLDDSLQGWMYLLAGKTEAQYQDAFDQKVNGVTEEQQVTVTCGGEKVKCFTIGVNANNQKENVLSFGDMGVASFVCNLPKGWETVEIAYTLNGETVAFELSAIDLGA